MLDYDKILVIINPRAGFRKTAKVQEAVDEYLRSEHATFESRVTQRAGDAMRWARSARAEGFKLIAVCGGDGTIREAVEGLLRSSAHMPLAIIPTGTGNITARALDIPIDVRKALALLSSGRPRAFDLGYLPEHDRYFVFVTGCGYDAQLIHGTPREHKKRLGFLAYVASGIKHFFTVRPVQMQLEIDNEVTHLRAHTAMAINIGSIAAIKFSVGPNIDPHDGKLNIMVLSSRSFWGSLIVLMRVFTKRYYGYSDIKHFRGERVRVNAQPPLPVQFDGEALGTTPFLAEVIPDGVQFVVPAAYDSKIFATY